MSATESHSPVASTGDWIVIEGRTASDHGRRGLILEVLGEPDHVHYRVKWDEAHESLFYPSGGFSIEHAKKRPSRK